MESSRQEMQLCFRLHLDRRSTHKIMGLRNCRSPKFGNFGTLTWESRDKKPFGCGPRGEKYIIRGEGGGFPQVWAVVNLVNSSLHVARFSTKSAQTMH